MLGRPGQAHVLGVQEYLGAEAAAHVGRDHPHLVLGQAQHEGRHQQPLDVRILVGDIQHVLLVRAVVAADRHPRLDRVGDQAVVHQVELRHVRGRGERGVHRALVAQRPLVALVVRRFIVDGDAALLLRGIRDVDDSGQHLVVHDHRLGRIARLLHRLGHHHGHVVAHVAHLVDREDRVRRLLHRRAVGVVDQPAARQPAHLALDVLAGDDAHHAGHLRRGRGVDRFESGVRVRRAHEDGVGLAGQGHVVGVLAGAGQEAIVFLASEASPMCGRLAKSDAPMVVLLMRWRSAAVGAALMALPPICTALTMFW